MSRDSDRRTAPNFDAGPWHIPFIFAVTFIIHHIDRNAIAYALPKIASELEWSDRARRMGAISARRLLPDLRRQIAFSGAAERFGAKRSMIAAIVGFSLVSMAVGPLAVRWRR